MKFGDRLKSARENKGFTQQYIADLMGIDKSTYCGYEIGKRTPDVEKIKALSNILNVSANFLIGVIDEEKPATISDDGLTDVELKLLRNYRELPQEKRALLETLSIELLNK